MELKRRIKYFLIRKLAKLLINGIIWSCRFQISGMEVVADARKKKIPVIYVYWHRNILVTIYRFKNTGARPLISLSEDGELVSQIALEFGMAPVRGSSSKGGARAFIELIDSIKKDNSEVLITTDGPKGPAREVKDGVIRLAEKTGAVVIPVCWNGNRVKIFEKSWDRFKIPTPFSRVVYAYGQPVLIPRDLTEEEFLQVKTRLKESIDTLEESIKF